MADTTKSIKSATDVELNSILNRLRREREVLRMLQELKSKSISNPNGNYPIYDNLEALSTETPIHDNKSIKQMTDDELEVFLSRLRSENETASIINEIRRINNPPKVDANGNYIDVKMYEGIDLDTPVKDLYHEEISKTLSHFGIPGMRWGQRNGSSDGGNAKQLAKADKQFEKKGNIRKVINKATAKMNMSRAYIKESENVYEDVTREIAREGRNRSRQVIENLYQDRMVSVIDRYMKADPSTYNPSKTSRVAFVFVEVNGNNYMTPAIVKADSIMHADDKSLETNDLFVLGVDGKITVFKQIDDFPNEDIDNTLAHFGIPGMRWGVRRASSKTTPKGSSDYLESRALKKKGIKNLSTAELKTLTTRKQLETNYKNLSPGVVKKGMSAGKAVLAGMAAVTTVYAFANSPIGQKIIDKSTRLVAKAAWKTVGG